MLSPVSNRYKRASMIVTSQALQRLGLDFRRRHGRDRDDRPALQHSEILSLKGDRYRLRGKALDTRIGAKHAEIA